MNLVEPGFKLGHSAPHLLLYPVFFFWLCAQDYTFFFWPGWPSGKEIGKKPAHPGIVGEAVERASYPQRQPYDSPRSYIYLTNSSNKTDADVLAKEGIQRPSLILSYLLGAFVCGCQVFP